MLVEIRGMLEADHRATDEMIKASLRDSFEALYPQELIKEFCAKYDGQEFAKKADEVEFFVAQDQGSDEIVGVIGLKDNELRTFFVHPEYQGKGIGRMLYNHLELIARERGLEKITLEGSPLGEPIYECFGFKKIKTINKERNGIRYSDALMEKDLLL